MPTPNNIEQTMALYWEGNREEVRKRYEDLFGVQDAPQEENSRPVEAEESDKAEEEPEDEALSTENESVTYADDDAYLSAILNDLQFPELIERKLREIFPSLADYERPIAFHHLNWIGDFGWTVDYQFEGMLNFWDTWTATHILHRFYPESVFPIDADQRYYRLRSIFGTFGIHYDDQENLLPITIAINLSAAVEEFRKQHNLEHWQMWALVYDLGPRLLPPLEPYPVNPPPRVWITAAGPENFALVDKH